MKRLNIILYVCNWGPHTAFQQLQDARADIPDEIKMIRIPCTGRISKSLLFKPFEMGADGVVLMGCTAGSCRYGSGTITARENARDTREILNLLGMDPGRLVRKSFLPDEHDQMLDFLKDFTRTIRSLGKSPIQPDKERTGTIDPAFDPLKIAARYAVTVCQDCGKCTAACPLSLSGKAFSPRTMAGRVLAGEADSPEVKAAVFGCLTCGTCYDRCPSAVDFPSFIKEMRYYYQATDQGISENHGGFFQSMMRAMTAENLEPSRYRDLPEDVNTDKKGKVLFFGGCAPYFDIFFRKFHQAHTNAIVEDSLRILNFFDIDPVLLEDERCCGHDLLWSGQRDGFLKLARLNAEAINKTGADTVLTACPECYMALNHEYPRHGIDIKPEIVHLHAFIQKEIEKGSVGFKKSDHHITFQDACRQSRMDGRPDQPRKLIDRLCVSGFSEMSDCGSASVCCGNSAWMGCDAYSKAMQVKRLTQAKQTGSDLLVTACPKCQIHLRCAMEDPFRADDIKMEITDLTGLIAKTIYWE